MNPRHIRDLTPEEMESHPLFGREYPEEFENCMRETDEAINELLACFDDAMPTRSMLEAMEIREARYRQWLAMKDRQQNKGATPRIAPPDISPPQTPEP